MSRKLSLCIIAMLVLASTPIVHADGARQTVGIYANDIDYNNCLGDTQGLFFPAYYEYVRTTDPYAYDKVIVLGGHMAPTDAHMPNNIAQDYLPNSYRNALMQGHNNGFCLRMNVHAQNGQQTVEMYFIAGSDRENTMAQFYADNDGDLLPNGEEWLLGVDPDNNDSDWDWFCDFFETANVDGFYDPNIANEVYLISFDVEGRQNSADYYDFLYLTTGARNAQQNVGGGCTVAGFVNALDSVRDAMTAPGRSILYIDINSTYTENGFMLSDTFVTIEEFDALLNSIDCIKCVNFANAGAVVIDISRFDNGSGKLISSTDLLQHLYEVNAQERFAYVDTNGDNYLSLQELIDDYIANRGAAHIALRSPLGSDIERILSPGLFQFGVRVSF